MKFFARFMKLSFLLVVAVVAISTNVQAQYVKRNAKDSITAAGTHYNTFTFTPDGVTAISISDIKAASGGGTVNAIQSLEYRVDSTLDIWEHVPGTDTLTLTNVGTAQGHIWPISTQSGNGYRVKTTATGTQKVYIYLAYLRRQIR